MTIISQCLGESVKKIEDEILCDSGLRVLLGGFTWERGHDMIILFHSCDCNCNINTPDHP